MIYSKDIIVLERPGRGGRGVGALPYKRLMAMCRLMGSHFHDWIDYNGVAFSIELHFRIFGVRQLFYLRLANVPGCLYCR